MPGFLYFLPNERTFQLPHLAEYGLNHIVDGSALLNQQQVVRGPDGQPGVLIGASDRWDQSDVKWSDRLNHKPFPKPHASKQAVCCWLSDVPLPTPDELARSTQLAGEVLTLADGRHWLIPHARRWQDAQYTIALPRTIDVNDDGGFIYGDVLPQYRKVWEHASRYWQTVLDAAVAVSDGSGGEFVYDNPMQLIVDSIAVNYRVSARELGVLQAIDDHMLVPVASVLIDAAGMKQLEKKTENATGNG